MRPVGRPHQHDARVPFPGIRALSYSLKNSHLGNWHNYCILQNAVALLGQAGSDSGIGAPRVEAFLRIG